MKILCIPHRREKNNNIALQIQRQQRQQQLLVVSAPLLLLLYTSLFHSTCLAFSVSSIQQHHLHRTATTSNSFSGRSSSQGNKSKNPNNNRPFVQVVPLYFSQQRQQSTNVIEVTSTKEEKSSTTNEQSDTAESNLHPITIDAITEALILRSQNKKNTLPLRLYDDEYDDKDDNNILVEPYQIMMTAGRIAQTTIQKAKNTNSLSLSELEEQVLGGRVVAIINRFEELEDELIQRAAAVATTTTTTDTLFSLSDNGTDEKNNKDDIDIIVQQQQQQQKEFFGVIPEEIQHYQKNQRKNKNNSITNNSSSNNNNKSTLQKQKKQERILLWKQLDAAILGQGPSQEQIDDNGDSSLSSFARTRAESLVALFLELVEGPGLRANNVILPCMDVDFLSEQRYQFLFPNTTTETETAATSSNDTKNNVKKEEEQQQKHQLNMEKLQQQLDTIATATTTNEDNLNKNEEEDEETPILVITNENENVDSENNGGSDDVERRPSLHPLTIDIISESLRIRARNDTKTPLRILSDDTEGWEIHYSAGKIAERFIQQYQQEQKQEQDGKAVVVGSTNHQELTEEEIAVIGGRVVGIVMRMEDLEWELNHRCHQEYKKESSSSSWISTNHNEWDNFGILPNESCIKTLDERILNDPIFTRNRAERLLALFLLNLERPGVEAAGDSLPGGSDADFLKKQNKRHYQIMLPRS